MLTRFALRPATYEARSSYIQFLPAKLARQNLQTFLPSKLYTRPSAYPRSLLTSQTSSFSTSSQIMASDDAYASFLDKANADLDAGRAPQQGASSSHAQTKIVDSSLKLPSSLQSIEEYYVSDTDEPFEPVALRWEGAKQGKWPSADDLSSLIAPGSGLSGSISTLSAAEFDPKKSYSAVLSAVRAAVAESSKADPESVDIKVYRVELTSTKLEYFVLALDSEEGGRIVGLRAKAVES
ncbi:hypothetical protein N7470_005957 [Penicillium chermesinum]|nr:hypothetical protein N7470_005957 [Penicillium chermesinum]